MLGQLVEVNGWGDGGAGEPLVVGIVAPGFVLINLVVLLPPTLGHFDNIFTSSKYSLKLI